MEGYKPNGSVMRTKIAIVAIQDVIESVDERNETGNTQNLVDMKIDRLFLASNEFIHYCVGRS